ncbi:nucleoside-specific channel-forming protein Tsx [Bacteriovorax sp. Seq25_V]|uniref:nucleoside-specific channel-forming protein Tsx n=1 Tax=Bacteriovorax sp. Seq25_V TaxID=1201288 RepID=UPI00038A14E6|nr:nucleoside-specific channel-forming protein Tsx [Bacteriovorax sp. Seq25_V]EQC47213.1 nucleoside-specific channel-forming protein Tsx [Bacteriovorax sp. Seq25_V]
MKKILLTILLTNFSTNASTWSQSSISYLRGSNFATVFNKDNNRSELTIDNAVSMKYGDSYFWLDITDPFSSTGSNDTELYGEWSPRLSIGKIAKFYNQKRLVKDFLLSTTFEFGNSGTPTRARLYGFGVDFNIPYFTFFNYNLYLRDNPDKTGTTLQSTIAYKMPITLSSKIHFIWSAYIDIVHGDEGSKDNNTLTESHWQTGQQLNFDLGNFWGKAESLLIGFEYQYWSRKYGIQGAPVENNLKWMIKWIL